MTHKHHLEKTNDRKNKGDPLFLEAAFFEKAHFLLPKKAVSKKRGSPQK